MHSERRENIMSDPSIPDFYRRGKDLIARIDELAKSRGIDPEMLVTNSVHEGNGWIGNYILDSSGGSPSVKHFGH